MQLNPANSVEPIVREDGKTLWTIIGSDGNHRRHWHNAVWAETHEGALFAAKHHPERPSFARCFVAFYCNPEKDAFWDDPCVKLRLRPVKSPASPQIT